MANIFKPVIDRQAWVAVMPAPNSHAAGVSICCDLRNDSTRNPNIYQLVSNTVFNRFNIKTKGWHFITTLALAGTYGAGAGCVFAPSRNLKCTVSSGSTTSKVTTSTVINTVGVNMLANRGGDGTYGFRIRVIGNSAGGSGLVEERWIVANTGGASPTLYLDTPLSFTPANGDTYEILSGSVCALGAGTTAAGSWKAFEVATNGITSLSTTNLPATISTDFSAVALDEQYVPYDLSPGEGMIVGAGTYDSASKNCLTATATAAGTLTGQAAAGDFAIPANEYRNFQIRIVEDAAIPTAVNQRRIIASHTGGAGTAPVYTLGTNWSVTPSATAKYVIELPNLILLRSSGTTTVYTYNYSGATVNNGTNSINNDAWHTTYFGVAPASMAAGCTCLPAWGIRPDTDYLVKQGMIYNFRGGGSSNTDVLNIAGGTTGSWETAAVIDGYIALTTGSCGKYAPADQEGRFGYINFYTASALNQIYRFDVQRRVMVPYTPTDWIQAGTAAAGDRLATYVAVDGSDKYTVVFLLSHTTGYAFELIVQL